MVAIANIVFRLLGKVLISGTSVAYGEELASQVLNHTLAIVSGLHYRAIYKD
jgi:hypothetical protein